MIFDESFSQIRNSSKFSRFEAPLVDEGAKKGTTVTYDRRLETRVERDLSVDWEIPSSSVVHQI